MFLYLQYKLIAYQHTLSNSINNIVIGMELSLEVRSIYMQNIYVCGWSVSPPPVFFSDNVENAD